MPCRRWNSNGVPWASALIAASVASQVSTGCRQVSQFAPRCLLLVERAEPALFEIHREIARNFPEQRKVDGPDLVRGLNTVGLRRAGFSEADIKGLDGKTIGTAQLEETPHVFGVFVFADHLWQRARFKSRYIENIEQ